MDNLRYTLIILTVFLCSIPFSRLFAQSGEEPLCLFSDIPGNENPVESVPVLQDTSLRVAILFVQFDDWQTNIDARGSVGFKSFNQPDSIIYNKFRYPHYWEMQAKT